jgi:hypothetical protein
MVMREPRLMRNPNGGMLNVDVTLLHMGLSRCRSIAEDSLIKLQRNDATIDWESILNEIIDESRKTLHGIQDNDMQDEVGAILRDEEANAS